MRAGRLAVLAAALVLAAGAALAVRQWRRAAPAPGAGAPIDSSAAVDQALSAAGVDSARIKDRWVDEVQGIDAGDLDPARRELFLRYANAERCTCGCGYTLAGCLASDMTCEVSGPRARALLDSVRAGLVHDSPGLRRRPSGR